MDKERLNAIYNAMDAEDAIYLRGFIELVNSQANDVSNAEMLEKFKQTRARIKEIEKKALKKIAGRMQAEIKKFDPDKEYFFHEGCFINELSNSDNDPGVSIARARVEPGKTTKWHRLSAIYERYVILAGKGRVEVTDLEPQLVTEGDVVIIPPKARQRITNTGDVDLVFLAICSPRFRESAYTEV